MFEGTLLGVLAMFIWCLKIFWYLLRDTVVHLGTWVNLNSYVLHPILHGEHHSGVEDDSSI